MMIKTIDIINKLNKEEKEKYSDMLKQVNIPDFYKCIAQFSGIAISKLSENTMADYLITWAKNKYRFYKMLGDQLRLDQKFIYENEQINYRNQYKEIMKKFPVYALWLEAFCEHKTNNIGRLDYCSLKYKLKDLFPKFQYEKSTITHFFKSQLDAPDELVTEIGKIYENKQIEATHTLSINPVDIMLASENPYEWDSCYRLELERPDSHADGCMAAVLDTSSLISYVWSSHGEYNMYDKFKFKDIRYYRIRQWVNISDGYEAVHFASAYPNRDGYDGELNKQLRDVVETIIAKYAGVNNKWRKVSYFLKNDYNQCEVQIDRETRYGYNEFDEDYIWVNSILMPVEDETKERKIIQIKPYNVEIKCACGCGTVLYGSDEIYDEEEADVGDICYNGEGFCAENFYTYEESGPENLWCEYCDGDCKQGLDEYDCCEREECSIWRDTHKPCDLDPENILCSRANEVSTFVDNKTKKEICNANECDCEHCYHWKDFQKEKENKKKEEENQ